MGKHLLFEGGKDGIKIEEAFPHLFWEGLILKIRSTRFLTCCWIKSGNLRHRSSLLTPFINICVRTTIKIFLSCLFFSKQYLEKRGICIYSTRPYVIKTNTETPPHPHFTRHYIICWRMVYSFIEYSSYFSL